MKKTVYLKQDNGVCPVLDCNALQAISQQVARPRKPPTIGAKILVINRVTAYCVSNFVAMATEVGCRKI